jgi:hypothetical protein
MPSTKSDVKNASIVSLIFSCNADLLRNNGERRSPGQCGYWSSSHGGPVKRFSVGAVKRLRYGSHRVLACELQWTIGRAQRRAKFDATF